MPSILTHSLMAEKVFKDMPDNMIKQMIIKYHEPFMLGANGPDFLYYHSSLPGSDQKQRKIYTDLANDIHSEHINDFYHIAFKRVINQEDEDLKGRMIAYLAGHLCHWALDCIAHPFIFYRTDGNNIETKYYHFRYEAMIDNYMLEHLKDEKLISLPSAALLNHKNEDIIAIKNIYIPIIREIWAYPIDEKAIVKAFRDFHYVLLLSYDPVGVWYGMVRFLEWILKDKWKFTSHFITLKKDQTRDILNINHQKWSNPCDCSDVHHESFLELFDLSLELGIKVSALLDKAIQDDSDKKLLNFINNRSYDTGHSDLRSMKYFDPIY